MRIGLHKLSRAKQHADDWAWIVDHTMQIGVEKCLVVVGLRLSELPEGVSLRRRDIEPLALFPVKQTSGEVVAKQLAVAATVTGAPRLIVADHGSDIKAGIEQFCRAHPSTDYIYDIKHKTAILLKRLLESAQSNWKAFASLAAKAARQLQQTALAPLRPPNQRSKARYMNVGPLVSWAQAILRVLDGRTQAGRVVLEELETTKEALEKSLGWLRDFKADIEAWSELHTIAVVAEDFVRSQGYTTESRAALEGRLRGLAQSPAARELRLTLLDFVQQQSQKARPGEKLLGSSEVLESLIGSFKHLEREQRHHGLTGLLLGMSALAGPTDAETIVEALSAVSTDDVRNWHIENVGSTVQSKRRKLLSELQPKVANRGTKMESSKHREKD